MQESPCSAFKKNPNGSWTCIKPVTISKPDGGQVSLSPGITITRGVSFMGLDVAKWLDENCT